ncbi:SPOR domain-containing protein [Aquaspirillum serpens]|uniref:SPOR domain-containing protein n=1 Tax=Aquaspirillum serpens TaxID=190 RepID=UPI0012DD95C6|nr:SPOR domain-containing protein [Aquaspirillum serpens]
MPKSTTPVRPEFPAGDPFAGQLKKRLLIAILIVLAAGGALPLYHALTAEPKPSANPPPAAPAVAEGRIAPATPTLDAATPPPPVAAVAPIPLAPPPPPPPPPAPAVAVAPSSPLPPPPPAKPKAELPPAPPPQSAPVKAPPPAALPPQPAPTAPPMAPPPAAQKPAVAAPPPSIAPAPPPSHASVGYQVQLGLFSNLDNAARLVEKLQRQGITVKTETRVHVGPFQSRAEAEEAMTKLKELGLSPLLAPAGAR